MKRIKILIIGSDSGAYGSAQSMLYLIKNLNKKNCNAIGVVPSIGVSDFWKKSNEKIYYVKMYKWIYIPRNRIYDFLKGVYKLIINMIAEMKIFLIIKKENPDIVHINTAALGCGALSAILLNKKLVWHFREYVESDLGALYHSKKISKYYFENADYRIAVSQSVMNYYNGILSKNCKCIYNGVLVAKFYQKRDILSSDKITITIPGRLIKQKGQYEVIEQIIKIRDILGDFTVYIIGDGDEEYKNQLRQLVKENQLEYNICFTGYTDHIEDFYKKTDIVIINSNREAFGRATVEAMLSGCLVIGKDTGGTSELLTDKRGYLYNKDYCDFCKLIFDILDNREEAKNRAIMAQEYAREYFTDEKNAENVLKVYMELLNEKI